ncbi:polysaccharide deacetylase family protein [Massilia sp. LXY-6]|uniref:polysaccharide deacetylase family protein n=1 Tax=Massilia sp. LXY-6 TaxID=3379823 RepID=UPI003EE21990
MVTRRDVLILGAAGYCLSACGTPSHAAVDMAAQGGAGAPPAPPHGPRPPAHGMVGTPIADWTAPRTAAGTAPALAVASAANGAARFHSCRLTQASPASSIEQAVLSSASGLVPKGSVPGFSVGIWARNPQARTLNFTFAIISAKGGHEIRWNCAVDPSHDWVFLTMSPSQQLAMGWQFGTDVPAAVRITQQDRMEEGPWKPGESLLFGSVYVDIGSKPLFLVTFDDGFASQARPPAPGAPSGRELVERKGFKGNLFIVPSWLGTTGVHGYGSAPSSFMSADDVGALHAAGWSIGSHTNTHPSSRDNAGLRLLGPYGYFLSNSVDRLPELYVRAWGLGAAHRRRANRAVAGSATITFENPHQFLVNMPIVFTSAAPPGFTQSTVYYVQSTPSADSATFATDQGSLRLTVTAKADWKGLADYRYAGSANDDRAIHEDILAGVRGLEGLGIRTGARFFALPQGSTDSYVRSACIRAGLKWVRGASLHGHSFSAGRPTGGGLQNIANQPGGWLAQPDCVQTDAAATPSLGQIRDYVDATITQGACGCSYHHDVRGPTVGNLEGLCAHLRRRVDAGEIDVVTLDRLARILGW